MKLGKIKKLNTHSLLSTKLIVIGTLKVLIFVHPPLLQAVDIADAMQNASVNEELKPIIISVDNATYNLQ